MKIAFIVPVFTLITFCLTACNDAQVKPMQERQAEPVSAETQADERGFDPCLLNANLPVCASK